MASVTSSGSGGNQILTDSTIGSATINNGQFAYFAFVEFTKQGGDQALYGVRISYSITSPLP
jgi:hypothetical protein